MEDPIPTPNVNDLELLSIPPFDHHFLTDSFQENFPGDDFPFDFDFDFTVDDLSFADGLLSESQLEYPEVRIPNSEDIDTNRSPTFSISRVYDCALPDANHDHGPVSSGESNFGEKLSCPSPEYGSCKSNSGVSNAPSSGDSGNNSYPDVSSTFSDNDLSVNGDIDGKIRVERLGSYKNCVSKRKKEQEQEECRISKSRRSSKIVGSGNFNVGSEEDEKWKTRLMRNRESAQLSRQRKKQYVKELEDKVRSMQSTITELNRKISCIMAENVALRQQLGGFGSGMPPPPHPGMMYPMAPMPYPWTVYPHYMVKSQGSQVPLVPIPRLKPQQPTPSHMGNNKKSDNRKSDRKTKKVASISFLGLLFFMLLFGGLVPMVNVRHGGSKNGFSDPQKGAVLMIDKHVERKSNSRVIGILDAKFSSHGRILQELNSSDRVVHTGNSSEPLVASLYVPRNDKLVRIDGNLIIHSVLASEKAMASHAAEVVKTSEDTRLAIPGSGMNNGRHSYLDKTPNRRQRALGSGSSDDFKPAGSDGKLQQWFREGLAGPMLSSGMCTEVFQFDVSPAPGAIAPVTSIDNITPEHQQNSTLLNKPRNRRILHGHPIPLDRLVLNATEEYVSQHGQNDGLQSNRSHSSMVVSVLVDPREAGDGDGEGVIRSKTLSRIFVVVLIDSVKYVTYSCMLPFVGSGAHLVTT